MPRQIIPASFKRTLNWFCAGAGALIPGYSFFTTFPPPIFPGISLLTSALSAAMIYITWHINSSTSYGEVSCPRWIQRASIYLVVSFCSLAVYVLLLRYCTILDPQSYSQRFQIGFWKFDWSLTDIGISLKSQAPLAPVDNWMLREGAFTQGGPEIIWRAWSVVAAGCAMILTYMMGFVFWTLGFASLAKHQQESRKKNKGQSSKLQKN